MDAVGSGDAAAGATSARGRTGDDLSDDAADSCDEAECEELLSGGRDWRTGMVTEVNTRGLGDEDEDEDEDGGGGTCGVVLDATPMRRVSRAVGISSGSESESPLRTSATALAWLEGKEAMVESSSSSSSSSSAFPEYTP